MTTRAGAARKIAIRRIEGTFEFVFEADPSIPSVTKIFVPRIQYPQGCTIEVIGGEAKLNLEHQLARVKAHHAGETSVFIRRVA